MIKWSGAVSLTWDRGTSQGYGIQTDTWTLGAGVSYTPTENVEFALGWSSRPADERRVRHRRRTTASPTATTSPTSFGNDLVDCTFDVA